MKIAMSALIGIVVLLIAIAAWSKGRVEDIRDPALAPPGGGTESDIVRLVDAGQMIAAIKLYRRLHGVGLKEAKDAVDKLARERQPEMGRTG